MKKILLFLSSLLVGIVLFIWIGKTVGWQEIRNAFLAFTGWQGIAIFLLTLLVMSISNWKWLEILRGEGVKMSFRGLFRPYLAGFAVMFLAPVLFWGGEIFRGYILKKKYSVPWTKGMPSIIIDRILEWTANLTIIFLGVLIFLVMIDLPPAKLGIIFSCTFLLFAIGISYFYLKVFKRESIVKLIFRIPGLKKLEGDSAILKAENEIFHFFKYKKKALAKAFGLAFLRTGAGYLRAWFLILFLGKEVSLAPVLSILSFNYLAMMIPIPAALGSHEAIQIFAFNALGLDASTATAFTMLIRGAELIFALIGVVILFRLGVVILKNTLFKVNEAKASSSSSLT